METADLRRESDELRDELRSVTRLLRWHVRERMLIEEYLEGLTSRKHWGRLERIMASLIPYGWVHALRVLYREPFSIWIKKERERLIELEF